MPTLHRTALWTLALVASAAVRSSAAPPPIDRPIIIVGGSPLVIEQKDGKLKRIDDRNLITQFPNYTVTSVEVNGASGGRQTVKFDREQCEVQLAYGDLHIAVQTDPAGQNLRVVAFRGTLFSKNGFRKGRLRFAGEGAAIRDLQVLKGGAAQRVEPPAGHTEIVIHYEGE